MAGARSYGGSAFVSEMKIWKTDPACAGVELVLMGQGQVIP